jgi:hypothetical protein
MFFWVSGAWAFANVIDATANTVAATIFFLSVMISPRLIGLRADPDDSEYAGKTPASTVTLLWS